MGRSTEHFVESDHRLKGSAFGQRPPNFSHLSLDKKKNYKRDKETQAVITHVIRGTETKRGGCESIAEI